MVFEMLGDELILADLTKEEKKELRKLIDELKTEGYKFADRVAPLETPAWDTFYKISRIIKGRIAEKLKEVI